MSNRNQLQNSFRLLFGLTLFLLAGCTPEKKREISLINDFASLQGKLQDPPSEYRSAPLWDWNDKITEEGIDFQMKKFKEGGLGGVFVHPRPGLNTENIAEDWHPLFDYTVQKGKELGLKVWIYDGKSYPEIFAFYIKHQQPGVDMLRNSYIPDGLGGQFGNTRAIRELRSAANQVGHIRILSETYGGAGWAINFANFKRLVDWQGVLGVNFVTQHLSYFTIKGVQKFDYPPSFSYHEPWWENFKPMGDYIGRISMAMSAGEQINKILVLQPDTTSWSNSSHVVKNSVPDTIQNHFKSFVYQLERAHYEYDLGSELVMRTIGSVKNGKMVVGKRTYGLVVIPATMENLDQATYTLLKEYLLQGGRILSFTRDIPRLDGVGSNLNKELMTAFKRQWAYAGSPEDKSAEALLANPDFSITEALPLQGELYHQRRILKDGELLFFVNTDTARNASATITGNGKSLIRMDLESGISTLLPVKSEDGQITFDLELSPVGSALYFLTKTNSAALAAAATVVTLPENSDEVVPIESPVNETVETVVKQGADNVLVLDFKTVSGFEVTCHFNVAAAADLKFLSALEVVVERPELWTLSLNGVKLSISDRWWIDREFFRFPAGEHLRKGANTLTLKAEKMPDHAEIMPAYLVGNFKLHPLKQGFEVTNGSLDTLGSWKSLGYPFYAQNVLYTQKYKTLESGKLYKIKLNQWNGTMAVVYLNGVKTGLITTPPYEMELPSKLQSGENTIAVEVIGSLKNTFGFLFKSSDNKWIIGSGDRDVAPAKLPAPEQYFLLDYGLFEPFGVISQN